MNNSYELFLYTGFLFLSVIISAYSQILLKKSAQYIHTSVFREYLNIYVITGYSIFFLAIFLDMLGLKKVPVSYIPIIESSSYIFVMLFSRFFLGEKLNKQKIFAIAIILAGIVVYIL